MKKLFLLILIGFSLQTINGYDKKSIIERFTNASCPPCATINNGWYNSLTTNLLNNSSATHVVYNVWWPGSSDPMYLFNQSENVVRTNYYSVNSVPSIIINGAVTSASESSVQDAVTNGNNEYSPFKIIVSPAYYSSNRINVDVKIIRDATDTSNPENLRLRVAITENVVSYSSPPGSNGESEFYSVCRKMIPDADGTSLEVPAPGDSIEISLEYNPDEDFVSEIDVTNLRAVAFIQNNSTDEIYQSAMADVTYIKQLEALFSIEEHVGVSPFSVKFYDHSTSTDSTQILTWEWDFNNDGTIDSEEQEPTWIFEEEGSYVVSLTVKDGIETYKKEINSFVNVVGNTSNILVVNGINYEYYPTDMTNFYANSVCFAGNNVDIWDLYGDQTFDYVSNESVSKTHLFSQYIPSDVLNLYEKVIWIGDFHMGGTETEMGDQIIQYVNQGGNFLLATNSVLNFFNDSLKTYCGISRFSPNSTVTGISAIDPNLVDQNVSSINTLIQFARLDESSVAIPVFTRIGSDDWIAGFTVHKGEGAGGFIYVAGAPYMYENTTTKQNFDYIVKNWLREDPVVSVENQKDIILSSEFSLDQNYPNPFNPNTTISFTIPQMQSANGLNVKLKIYDVLGKEIKTLINENREPGNYTVDFNASDLTSGIYYYQLSAGDFIETKKMILLK